MAVFYGSHYTLNREHDLCPYTLAPGECKRGLCNHQKFTRSHCDCDAKFRRCLQGLNTGNYYYLLLLFIIIIMVFNRQR